MVMGVHQNPFQSARLTYRALEPTDEPFVYELESDPFSFINSQLGLKRPRPRQVSRERFERFTESSLLAVAVCISDEERTPIGIVSLKGVPGDLAHHRYTEISIGLSPSYQGKGYGTEAINWALQWAFKSAGMHRVTVKAFEYNSGARRLYERLGFKHEGTIRETLWHDGRWWDDYVYGMLEGEWRAQQSE
jgi:RimJ/RimL family protein N-acetyltransferase